jgi:hypothetical protein
MLNGILTLTFHYCLEEMCQFQRRVGKRVV